MNQVYGKMNLEVSVDVESDDETMGLLEANYTFNPNRFIHYEITALDCKGIKHKIHVNDVSLIDLNEFID
jgi:hypothetical protein